jgi:ABC-type sulfate transport system permease component
VPGASTCTAASAGSAAVSRSPDIALFGSFVALPVLKRRDPQSHKRSMLLASIALVGAGVAGWPFAFMAAASPVPGFSMIDLCVDLFVVAMVVWDLASRGRVHPVTLWGGAVLIAFQPLGLALAGTHAWLAFAGWAVSLLGH